MAGVGGGERDYLIFWTNWCDFLLVDSFNENHLLNLFKDLIRSGYKEKKWSKSINLPWLLVKS